jgi:sugar fermentation stimulation protein A
MEIPGAPFIEGVFLERPNRFITKIQLGESVVTSHLADPGRLKELLFPGAHVLLRKHNDPKRKTQYTTVMVYQNEQLVSLNTQLPNLYVKYCLQNHLIPVFKDWDFVKAEVAFGHSRFDFLLKRGRLTKILEVKSVTLIDNGIAKFPDAITERGKRHVNHLTELLKPNQSTAVLFMIQREGATYFKPFAERDPDFTNALIQAAKMGVEIYAYENIMTPTHISLTKEIPINFNCI